MNLTEFRALLHEHPEKTPAFRLPGGGLIPAQCHVTEVGHVAKRFIDCGGTVRSVEACVLQTWIDAGDDTHRLTAGRLAKIIGLAAPILPAHELPVEIEHEAGVISQYPVTGHTVAGDTLVFQLGAKHTDCLAKELCGLGAIKIGAPVNGKNSCCGPAGCC